MICDWGDCTFIQMHPKQSASRASAWVIRTLFGFTAHFTELSRGIPSLTGSTALEEPACPAGLRTLLRVLPARAARDGDIRFSP